MLKTITTAGILTAIMTGAFALQVAPPTDGPAAPAVRARVAAMRAPRTMGKITAISGTTYTLKPTRGAEVKVEIASSTPVMKPGRVRGTVPDLKVGMDIAVQGAADAKGVVKATRVNVQNPAFVGTVQTITASRITVRDAQKNSSTFLIDAKTRIRKAGIDVKWSNYKAGDTVSVQYSGALALTIGSGAQNRAAGTRARATGVRQRGARRGGAVTPANPATATPDKEPVDETKTEVE